MKKEFRIYGYEDRNRWKLLWASQGKNNDIQFGAHFFSGLSYYSIHESGEVHITTIGADKKQYVLTQNYPWKLSTFRDIQIIASSGLSKEVLKHIPTLKKPKKKKIIEIDLSNYQNELNYWIYLVDNANLDRFVEFIDDKFPGVLLTYDERFKPILCIIILDPTVNAYGFEINAIAKENTIKVRMGPDIRIIYNE